MMSAPMATIHDPNETPTPLEDLALTPKKNNVQHDPKKGKMHSEKSQKESQNVIGKESDEEKDEKRNENENEKEKEREKEKEKRKKDPHKIYHSSVFSQKKVPQHRSIFSQSSLTSLNVNATAKNKKMVQIETTRRCPEKKLVARNPPSGSAGRLCDKKKMCRFLEANASQCLAPRETAASLAKGVAQKVVDRLPGELSACLFDGWAGGAISVPDNLYEGFLNAYSEDAAANRALYVAERISQPTFRFFVDLDLQLPERVTDTFIAAMVNMLQEVVATFYKQLSGSSGVVHPELPESWDSDCETDLSGQKFLEKDSGKMILLHKTPVGTNKVDDTDDDDDDNGKPKGDETDNCYENVDSEMERKKVGDDDYDNNAQEPLSKDTEQSYKKVHQRAEERKKQIKMKKKQILLDEKAEKRLKERNKKKAEEAFELAEQESFNEWSDRVNSAVYDDESTDSDDNTNSRRRDSGSNHRRNKSFFSTEVFFPLFSTFFVFFPFFSIFFNNENKKNRRKKRPGKRNARQTNCAKNFWLPWCAQQDASVCPRTPNGCHHHQHQHKPVTKEILLAIPRSLHFCCHALETMFQKQKISKNGKIGKKTKIVIWNRTKKFKKTCRSLLTSLVK